LPRIFSRTPVREPVQRPSQTINGLRQRDPEQPGTLQRRARLFVECTRRIAKEPLADQSASGVPIGDGYGMEQLVSRIAPLFDKERSLLRWVALRGAFSQLYISSVDRESRTIPFSPAVEAAMGIRSVRDPASARNAVELAPGWASRLAKDQQHAIVEIFSAVAVRVLDYDRYSQLPMGEVNQDARCRLNDAMALDFIAWTAVALLRTGQAPGFWHAPEPDALYQPGWYTDPLWGKAQRYWDATDWTDRVRTSDGQEGTSQLRPPEPQLSRAAQHTGESSAHQVGPTVEQVLAEWHPGSRAADLTRWREGTARYDATPIENRAEMRACAELMCAALPHFLRGQQHTLRVA
jgi:hypothetical protein